MWIDLSLYYQMPVPLLQKVITSRHFTELSIYLQQFPHWSARLDALLANIAKEIQWLRSIQTKETPEPLAEFMLFEPDEDTRMAERDMQANAKLWASLNNGEH